MLQTERFNVLTPEDRPSLPSATPKPSGAAEEAAEETVEGPRRRRRPPLTMEEKCLKCAAKMISRLKSSMEEKEYYWEPSANVCIQLLLIGINEP